MGKKVIAAYIRLSVEDGDLNNTDKQESNSVTHQRMLIQRYIQSKTEFDQYEVVEFCDDGYSGTNFERPAFQSMMMQVKLKKINCIIVKDLSRFGREYLEVGSYVELVLPIFDTRFISINDRFDTNDYIGTTGGIELALRNLINGMYSQDISVKVKSALKTRHRQGEYIGGNPFYGYIRDPKDKHHLIVDEQVRPVIERIFRLTIDGCSSMQIARVLNTEGILCPVEYKKLKGIRYSKQLTEKKALWIQCTVRKIVKDLRYTGKMVNNVRHSAIIGGNVMVNNSKEDWIIVDGTHEAIVSDETYIAANQALSSRVRVANPNTSWKHSKNLFICGCCGRKLQKYKTKDGVILYCVKSRYEANSGCAAIKVNQEHIQRAVLKTVQAMGQTFTDGITIHHKAEDSDAGRLKLEIEALRRKVEKHNSEKSSLYERYRSGEFSREAFINLQKSRSEWLEATEARIAEMEKELSVLAEKEGAILLIREELRTAENLSEYDADVMSQIIEKVIVHKDSRIELVMKNQDAYQSALEALNQ